MHVEIRVGGSSGHESFTLDSKGEDPSTSRRLQRTRCASMNSWQLLVTDDGSPTLVHPVHGEACHSRAGAWLESRERYARACRVRERAEELARRGERVFRLLDVGTGLGLNVAAALDALEGTGVVLDVVTLELDASVIERTLSLARTG